MSDTKESHEKLSNKQREGAKNAKAFKGETRQVNGKSQDQLEKVCNSQCSSENQSKNGGLTEEEEYSAKNPKLKKDLKELLENFCQDNSSLQKKSALHFSAEYTASEIDRTEEPLTQQSVDQEEPSIGDFCGEKHKISTEDTTLDGKFIEIRDENCGCHLENCECGRTDQNITDIDESQANYANNEVLLPYDFCTYTPSKHQTAPEDCLHKCEVPPTGKTNRYNYNVVHMRPYSKECRKLNKLFPRREMKESKHHFVKHDSGETIPQLYKANVKHLGHCGVVPERFTFKAVTGNIPGRLLYGPCAPPYPTMVCCPHHYNLPSKNRVNFMDDIIVEKGGKKHKKERRNVFKPFRKSRNFSSHTNKHNTHKNQQYNLSDRACMRFDGNEYISTKELPDRIDIYCFDHLNTSYFRTCDQPPPLITEIAMEKTEEIATHFWAEIFGFIHIIIAFFIAFILQFYKFLLYSIVRPLMVGLVQLSSDYFFKPLLTITYNGFTQPFLVFLFNVAASFRDLCSPIAKGLGYFISEIAVIVRAFRLVDCSKNNAPLRRMKDSCC